MQQVKEYTPSERKGHSMVRIGDHLYLWGGYQPSLPFAHDSEQKRTMSSRIEVYHLPTGRWEQKPTTGNPPLGITGYATAAIGNEIFYFGGYCNHDDCYHNSLYSLDVATLNWRELSFTDTHHGPMMKSHCGMIALQLDDGEDYLVVIGGGGPHPSTRQMDSQYSCDVLSDLERTNEVHYFCCKSNDWISPAITGDRPLPCDSFTLNSISNDTAILFGGNELNNKVYYCQFTRESASWKQLHNTSMGQWPMERSHHCSALIKSSVAGPHLLTVGGKNTSDSWLLDVDKKQWSEVSLPREVHERREHSLCTWSLSPTVHWIIEFGGKREGLLGAVLNDTTVIELIYSTEKEKWFSNVIPSDRYQERLRARALNENNVNAEDGGSEEEEGPTFKRLSCQALIEESVAERRRKMQEGRVEKNCCQIL
ncbi:PREDICTED: kelch domain-containing protein 2-like [Amphimedon queenslandica]|uniref:Uncharacterized protein n=1 Tax=Amphimedon queenslandica TaxID=400682 RepID=A0A1X7UA17_AMPQE|nr:PREDICTED: kelch domain-containing protein 2-like [Amphimedon queenslandica]|eukprot:XP_011405743.1 PREDICTED: kelch domain-containing protein 2-like [Amphimedon queenslandica]